MLNTEERIRAQAKLLKRTKAQEDQGPDWKAKVLAKMHGKTVKEIKKILKEKS